MWRPPINFISLHYAYILSFGILALVILLPYGNLKAVDAYFFGVSASTESGLNTIDLKEFKLYQQIFLYLTPIVTNLGFINIIVVVVRLHWFQERFKRFTPRNSKRTDEESSPHATKNTKINHDDPDDTGCLNSTASTEQPAVVVPERPSEYAPHISFAPVPERDVGENSIYTPAPLEREKGQHSTSLKVDEDEDAIQPAPTVAESSGVMLRRRSETLSLSRTITMNRAVSSIFVLGGTARPSQDHSRASEPIDVAAMSREELGGIEYRALRVMLKVAVGYFVGLHLLGVLFLVPWIHTSDAIYRDFLAEQGQDATWWGFYSSQTMISNLGFTLTPNSMISFRDAPWPMLSMSFLAFAGNTFYPCFMRLLVWIIYKATPAGSSLKESVRFLLDHPRRCYTLLFPSAVTWTLAAVLVVLNTADVLIIILLDLDNPEVNVLPGGQRLCAAIFQAASARHTGTASFNLANVNPAVQFSLLIMMYISIFPIAISIRVSSDYEDRPVGVYEVENNLDERRGSRSYMLGHMRNQLSFDLWYIFLGVFCVCAAESKRIMDRQDYAFSAFSVFFEVTSAYGNVGLSLGHPSNSTSLCGHFTVFSKLVLCAMMIRGRHRGLPFALDRAVSLPIDRLADEDGDEKHFKAMDAAQLNMKSLALKKAYTQ